MAVKRKKKKPYDDVVIKVNGKYHYCESCKVCNVFKHPDPKNLNLFKCNYCGTECEGC